MLLQLPQADEQAEHPPNPGEKVSCGQEEQVEPEAVYPGKQRVQVPVVDTQLVQLAQGEQEEPAPLRLKEFMGQGWHWPDALVNCPWEHPRASSRVALRRVVIMSQLFMII